MFGGMGFDGDVDAPVGRLRSFLGGKSRMFGLAPVDADGRFTGARESLGFSIEPGELLRMPLALR